MQGDLFTIHHRKKTLLDESPHEEGYSESKSILRRRWNGYRSRILFFVEFFLWIMFWVGLRLIFFDHPTIRENFLQRSTIGNASFNFLIESPSRDRGIVTCVHDGIFALGLSLVLELRCAGNTDPIQIAFCGDELSHTNRAIFQTHDPTIEFLDLCAKLKIPVSEHRHHRNYFLKPLAVLHAPFDQVMLMDADVILNQNPMRLWDHPEVKRTGTLFFRDKILAPNTFLGIKFQSVDDKKIKIPWIHFIFQAFNVTPFLELDGVGTRWKQLQAGARPVPSTTLTSSMAWKEKSGISVDRFDASFQF